LLDSANGSWHVFYSCHCAAGYEGDRCETNIDDCVEHQCTNNSTCVDLVESYRCQCLSGFTGKSSRFFQSIDSNFKRYLRLPFPTAPGTYCDKKIQFCTKEFNPCRNGATCVDRSDNYTCVCPSGFSGENCTVNNDDCVNHMCQVLLAPRSC